MRISGTLAEFCEAIHNRLTIAQDRFEQFVLVLTRGKIQQLGGVAPEIWKIGTLSVGNTRIVKNVLADRFYKRPSRRNRAVWSSTRRLRALSHAA